jgi:hypothetical protein
MLSESARMNSAEEARFRIQEANSLPRNIKVIALDRQSEGVVARLSSMPWEHASFFTTAAANPASGQAATVPVTNWFSTIDGQPRDLIEEVNAADLVVMVATAGQQANAAAMIGKACSHRRVMTTTLVVDGISASDETLAKTLAALRPWSLMMVIAGADDYIEDMLTALRAR